MDIFVTVDSGNSRRKIGLWDRQGTLLAHGYCDHTDITSATEALTATLPADCRIAGALCSHVGSGPGPTFRGAAVPLLDASTPMPLTIAYGSPSTLGADRLAAAAGAAGQFPGQPVLVADLGTAATFDLVDGDGTFRGGNIAPGVSMRMEALHEHTARLPLVVGNSPVEQWGTTTAGAIRSGAYLGLWAELCHYASAAGGRAIVTGGDAAAVLALGTPAADIHHDSSLVLRGLYFILLYNETNKHT